MLKFLSSRKSTDEQLHTTLMYAFCQLAAKGSYCCIFFCTNLCTEENKAEIAKTSFKKLQRLYQNTKKKDLLREHAVQAIASCATQSVYRPLGLKSLSHTTQLTHNTTQAKHKS